MRLTMGFNRKRFRMQSVCTKYDNVVMFTHDGRAHASARTHTHGNANGDGEHERERTRAHTAAQHTRDHNMFALAVRIIP